MAQVQPLNAAKAVTITNGRLTIAEKEAATGLDLANLLAYGDLGASNIAAEMGFNKTVKRMERLQQAAASPATYIDEATKRVKAIRAELEKKYQEEYSELIYLGLSPTEARAKALALVRPWAENENEKLTIDYPGTLIGGAAHDMNVSTKAAVNKLGIKGFGEPKALGF